MKAFNNATMSLAIATIVGSKVDLQHDDGTTEQITMKQFKKDYTQEAIDEIEEPITLDLEDLDKVSTEQDSEEVVTIIEQAEQEIPEAAPQEEEVTLADLKKTTKGEKKGGKQPDPNSGRQAILKVIFNNGNEPMAPSAINTILKAQGREIKYISSHLNYFKSHGQVIHVEGTSTYKLAQKTLDRLTKEAAAAPQLATV
jgi:predicted RNA binding protein YcfA (HicA-like mRNA interferase family)